MRIGINCGHTVSGQRHAETVAVCDKLHALGFVNRGVKNASLYVINHTNAKAMLIEVCFVDTQSDVDLYRKLGKDKIAAAIYEAVTGQTTNNTGTEGNDMTNKEYTELAARIERLEKPMIYNYIDKNMPEWARPTVQKLVDKGFLKGDGGGLGLTDELLRILVINDRAGLYDRVM